MLLNNVLKTVSTLAALAMLTAPVVAQAPAQSGATQPATATLSADGQLTGNVMAALSDKISEVPNAQVSLVSQGKVIDSVTADESGNFSFANVHPGPYQIVGTAAGLVGSNAVTVEPFTKTQPVTPGKVVLRQSAPEVVYDSFSATAPVTTFSSYPSSGGVVSGGMGRRIGGRLGGGRIGRGLLGSPRRLLLIGGIAGGLAAIEDSSPDM